MSRLASGDTDAKRAPICFAILPCTMLVCPIRPYPPEQTPLPLQIADKRATAAQQEIQPRLASEKISGDLIRDIRSGVWGVFYFIYSLGYVSNRPN